MFEIISDETASRALIRQREERAPEAVVVHVRLAAARAQQRRPVGGAVLPAGRLQRRQACFRPQPVEVVNNKEACAPRPDELRCPQLPPFGAQPTAVIAKCKALMYVTCTLMHHNGLCFGQPRMQASRSALTGRNSDSKRRLCSDSALGQALVQATNR